MPSGRIDTLLLYCSSNHEVLIGHYMNLSKSHFLSPLDVMIVRANGAILSQYYGLLLQAHCHWMLRKAFLNLSSLGAAVMSKFNVVFVLGGPGAGKGTQCTKIVEVWYDCVSMSFLHVIMSSKYYPRLLGTYTSLLENFWDKKWMEKVLWLRWFKVIWRTAQLSQ